MKSHYFCWETWASIRHGPKCIVRRTIGLPALDCNRSPELVSIGVMTKCKCTIALHGHRIPRSCQALAITKGNQRLSETLPTTSGELSRTLLRPCTPMSCLDSRTYDTALTIRLICRFRSGLPFPSAFAALLFSIFKLGCEVRRLTVAVIARLLLGLLAWSLPCSPSPRRWTAGVNPLPLDSLCP